MILTAEQFSEILGHLISDLSPKTAEKRREPRVGVRFEAMVTPLVPGAMSSQQRITIRDLSRSGMNMLSRGQMPKGTQFMMKMCRSDQHEVTALYRVCHCKPLGPTTYAVGAVLLSVTNNAVASLAA